MHFACSSDCQRGSLHGIWSWTPGPRHELTRRTAYRASRQISIYIVPDSVLPISPLPPNALGSSDARAARRCRRLHLPFPGPYNTLFFLYFCILKNRTLTLPGADSKIPGKKPLETSFSFPRSAASLGHAYMKPTCKGKARHN